MRKPQNLGAAVLLALLLSLIVQAQVAEVVPPTTTRGVELYHQGKTDEAIRVLSEVVKEHADDADAWYYLGLSQYRQEWIGGARDSFAKTVELRHQSADAHAKLAYALILGNEPKQAITTARRALELGDLSMEPHYAIAEASLRNGEPEQALAEAAAALKIKPDFLPALVTRSFAQQSLKQFSESAESLERLLALSPDDPEAKTWRSQIVELRNAASLQSGGPAVFTSKEVTQRARVFSKPEPGYTEQARKAGVMGTVILRAVFSAEGELTHVRITQALGYGLTTKAIAAARAMKFAPAIKDGKLVSQHVGLEYTFNLY
jgi:TonB family protein